jgi:hypothetical protein
MAKIKRIIVRVNRNERIYYQIDDRERVESLSWVLKTLFTDQGELYEKVYGVDRETAAIAGWHPYHNDFSEECEGWEKFLKDKGKVEKEVIEEEYTVEEFVRHVLNF